MQTHQGMLVSWFPTRSYGFIRFDSSPDEIFVHRTDFLGGKTLPSGTRVTFDVVEYNGRTKAVRVASITEVQ